MQRVKTGGAVMGKWIAMLLLAAGTATADSVIKCVDASGRITWTNVACPSGDSATRVQVQAAVTDSSGLRDWAKRNPARPVAVVKAPAQKPQKFIDPVECGNARRAHAFELGSRLRKADQVAYRRKEVCRACGECP
jgi:hypothetical protein